MLCYRKNMSYDITNSVRCTFGWTIATSLDHVWLNWSTRLLLHLVSALQIAFLTRGIHNVLRSLSTFKILHVYMHSNHEFLTFIQVMWTNIFIKNIYNFFLRPSLNFSAIDEIILAYILMKTGNRSVLQ